MNTAATVPTPVLLLTQENKRLRECNAALEAELRRKDARLAATQTDYYKALDEREELDYQNYLLRMKVAGLEEKMLRMLRAWNPPPSQRLYQQGIR